MKKLCTTLSCILLLSCIALKAENYKKRTGGGSQSDSTYNHVISAYPMAFFSSSMRIGYEQYLQKKKGLNIMASYASADNSNYYDANDVVEFMAELQMRFYVTKEDRPLNGFFMAPMLSFRQINFKQSAFTSDIRQYSASMASIGYLIGFQKVFPSAIAVGIFGGGGLNMAPSGDHGLLREAQFGIYSRGISPKFGFSLGFGF